MDDEEVNKTIWEKCKESLGGACRNLQAASRRLWVGVPPHTTSCDFNMKVDFPPPFILSVSFIALSCCIQFPNFNFVDNNFCISKKFNNLETLKMTQKYNHYNHCTEKGGRQQTYSSPAYKMMDIRIKQTLHKEAQEGGFPALTLAYMQSNCRQSPPVYESSTVPWGSTPLQLSNL